MSDRKPHLSPSQLDMMSRCGEAYRRRYIEGERIPPGIAMLSGTGVHAGAEVNFRQKIDTRVDLPADDIVDAAVDGFDKGIAGGYEVGPEDESPDAARDQVADLARLYADEIAPEYQPRFVEQSVRIELPGSHDMLGILDMADDAGRVVDLKTTGKSKSQAEADASPQLTFYAAAHKVLTGELASEVRLEVLVKSKTPKRVLLASTRGPADFAALANRINVASSAIAAGVFLPADPNSWMCSPKWCGFHATCPYVAHRERVLVDLAGSDTGSVSPIVRPATRAKSYANPLARMLDMNPHCSTCGCELTKRTAILGFVVPLTAGGINAPENYCLSCRKCAALRLANPSTVTHVGV
jgi:hypothetical protein